MSTIVTRAGKGSALTHTEMDANTTNLNNDKADVIGTPATGDLAAFDANDDIEAYPLSTLFDVMYPVGSVYINANVATNPGTLLGFGTWTAFGAGKVPVGLDSGDSDFDTGEETGGAKTHTISTGELPAHTHGSAGAHTHVQKHAIDNTGAATAFAKTVGVDAAVENSVVSTASSGAHTHSSVGSGDAHNNVQPYIVVYMWKRTV